MTNNERYQQLACSESLSVPARNLFLSLAGSDCPRTLSDPEIDVLTRISDKLSDREIGSAPQRGTFQAFKVHEIRVRLADGSHQTVYTIEEGYAEGYTFDVQLCSERHHLFLVVGKYEPDSEFQWHSDWLKQQRG